MDSFSASYRRNRDINPESNSAQDARVWISAGVWNCLFIARAAGNLTLSFSNAMVRKREDRCRDETITFCSKAAKVDALLYPTSSRKVLLQNAAA